MRTIMSRTGWLLLAFTLSVSLAAQEAGRMSIPESVITSLDGLQKTRTANGVFNIQYRGSYFWALEKSVYVNVAFSADLDGDAVGMKERVKKQYDEWVAAEMNKLDGINKKIKKEEDKKKWEPPAQVIPENFHNLYLRVIKGGQVIQEYRSRLPFDAEATDYYSFGTILEPGDYEVLLVINRTDNTLDGTQMFPLQVPALRLSDINTPSMELKISTPVFYAKVIQLLQPESRFSVVKNKFQIGPAMQEFHPWGDKPFKNSDNPTLAFFVLGTATPWNITATIEMFKGKELRNKFENVNLNVPYFFQPIEFVKKDMNKTVPLPAGAYTLLVKLTDNNQGGKAKGTFEIPFQIIE